MGGRGRKRMEGEGRRGNGGGRNVSKIEMNGSTVTKISTGRQLLYVTSNVAQKQASAKHWPISPTSNLPLKLANLHT